MRWTVWRVALAISALSILYLVVLFFDRRDVMEVKNVTINPPAIKAGDTYTFSFDARPLRDEGGEGVSIMTEIDSTGTPHLFNTPIILDRKEQGWRHYSRDVHSHRDLAPGEVINARNIYHWCFFLQRIWPIREHREVKFTVLPP